MIKAKHHRIIYPLFQWLTRVLLKQNFSSVHIEGEFIDRGPAVLVLANHIAWWDGFWMEYLNQKQCRRKLYFMMLEEQLKKHWYFQYAGGYSIRTNSRQVAESMEYTIELLKGDEHFVFLFPQGEIRSSHARPIRFKRGIGQMLEKTDDQTQVLFVASVFDYFSNPKPQLTLYLQQHTAGSLKPLDLEEAYNRFYEQALTRQANKVS